IGTLNTQHRLEHKADENRQRHGGEHQAQAQIAFFLLGAVCVGGHAITLVPAAFSLGGVSKVWKGAGEGTSHSSPSATSQGFFAAFWPLPRRTGSTMKNRK